MRYINESNHTLEELTARAISEAEKRRADFSEEANDVYWSWVSAIRRLANEEVLNLGLAWCNDESAYIRELGSDVLALLFRRDKTSKAYKSERVYAEHTAPMLTKLLQDDDEGVLMSAIYAVGHHNLEDASIIAQFANHKSEDIRLAVASSITNFSNAENDEFVQILLNLVQDSDNDVRNWAAFGFQIIETDSEEIRDALVTATRDTMSDVRSEAIVALVQRNYPDAHNLLLAELKNDEVYGSIYDAAEALGDPSIIPALRAHEERFGEYSGLTRVIEHLSTLSAVGGPA